MRRTRAWADRVRLAVEATDGTAPPLDTEAGALWLLLVDSQASRDLRAHRIDLAEITFRRILEALKHQPDSDQRRGRLAGVHNQLGTVAQMRGRLDEAADWYRQSLQIEEELDDRPGMALTYAQLGLLADERGQPIEALTWTVRSVSLFDEVPHHATGTGPTHLALLTAQLGPDTLVRVWREVTGNPLPNAVRDYVQQQGSDT